MSSVLSVGLFLTKIIALLFSPVYTMTPSVDKPLGLNTSCSSPLKSLIMLTSGHLKIAVTVQSQMTLSLQDMVHEEANAKNYLEI